MAATEVDEAAEVPAGAEDAPPGSAHYGAPSGRAHYGAPSGSAVIYIRRPWAADSRCGETVACWAVNSRL